MSAEFRSSEESGEGVNIVKPLNWRADRVTRFFHQLDEKNNASKTAQAKRQCKPCVTSIEGSHHSQPTSYQIAT